MRISRYWGFSALFVAALAFVACGDDKDSTGPSTPEVRVTVRFSADSVNMLVSQSMTAHADVTAPTGKSTAVTWSTKCNVLTLSTSGEIKALTPGACKVVVTSVANMLYTDTLYVTIYAPSSIKISPLSGTVKKGASVDFTYTRTGGLPGTPGNPSLASLGGTCSSSNAAVATVVTLAGNICRATGVFPNSPASSPIQIVVKAKGVDPVSGQPEASASLVVTP